MEKVDLKNVDSKFKVKTSVDGTAEKVEDALDLEKAVVYLLDEVEKLKARL